MLKKILILISLLSFFSCSSVQKREREWTDPNKIIDNINELKTGDIIIVNKHFDLYSVWGHSAIYLSDTAYVGEYPQLGYGFFYVPIDIWVKEIKHRKVIVLRLKNITDDFRYDLQNIIEENKYKNYKIVFDKNSNEAYYCSQWVWKMFQITAEKYGVELDLDSDKGVLVLPYDFLDSEFLEVVNINY